MSLKDQKLSELGKKLVFEGLMITISITGVILLGGLLVAASVATRKKNNGKNYKEN